MGLFNSFDAHGLNLSKLSFVMFNFSMHSLMRNGSPVHSGTPFDEKSSTSIAMAVYQAFATKSPVRSGVLKVTNEVTLGESWCASATVSNWDCVV